MLTKNLYIYDKAVTKYNWWDTDVLLDIFHPNLQLTALIQFSFLRRAKVIFFRLFISFQKLVLTYLAK